MLLFSLLFLALLLMIMLWMTLQAEWFANHGESLKGGSGQAPPTAHLVDICQSFLSQESRIYMCAQCDLLIYVCSIRLANVHVCWTLRQAETDWWERGTDGKFQVSADDSSCYWRPAWPTSVSTFQEKKSIVCWLLKLNVNVWETEYGVSFRSAIDDICNLHISKWRSKMSMGKLSSCQGQGLI